MNNPTDVGSAKYDLDKSLEGYREDFEGIDQNTNIKNILRYYKNVGHKLIEHCWTHPTQFYDAYAFN